MKVQPSAEQWWTLWASCESCWRIAACCSATYGTVLSGARGSTCVSVSADSGQVYNILTSVRMWGSRSCSLPRHVFTFLTWLQVLQAQLRRVLRGLVPGKRQRTAMTYPGHFADSYKVARKCWRPWSLSVMLTGSWGSQGSRSSPKLLLRMVLETLTDWSIEMLLAWSWLIICRF